MVELELFGGHRSFIVVSELKDFRDTGGIFDDNMRLLGYFRHEYNLRTPRGVIFGSPRRRLFGSIRRFLSMDIYLETVDGVLFGEINQIPPKVGSMRLIRSFEIYDNRKELVGVVREKLKFVGSDWVLVNLEEQVIASVFGDRKRKDYEIQTPDGSVLARCSRDSSLDRDAYKLDIVGGGVDLFLVLYH